MMKMVPNKNPLWNDKPDNLLDLKRTKAPLDQSSEEGGGRGHGRNMLSE